VKLTFGLLMAGVSAIALAGCNTSGGGFNGNAMAILGSGVVNPTTHQTTSQSAASADTLTNALITYNDLGAAGPSATDTVSVQVQNGGQVSGPMTYTEDGSGLDNTGDANGITGNGTIAHSGTSAGYSVFADFIPTPTSATQDSILVAGTGADSFAGFVGTNDKTSGAGNIAAGFGGTAPSGSTPTIPVTYSGNAATVVQQAGTNSFFRGGTSTVHANFTSGAVDGALAFTSGPNITFAGAMSSSKATYSANSVTFNGAAGTGQVQGGFFGPGYAETAGSFDVQETSTGIKATGAFGGSLPLP